MSLGPYMYACNIINTKIISIKNYNNVGKKKVKCHLSCVMCTLSFFTCHLSPHICHLSPDTCHLSPVTFHLTTTLCSFSCCESPRNFDDWASGGLVSDRVKKPNFFGPIFPFLLIFTSGRTSLAPIKKIHRGDIRPTYGPHPAILHNALQIPKQMSKPRKLSKLKNSAVQRTGSPIGDLGRNYASIAKLVAFKLFFCI